MKVYSVVPRAPGRSSSSVKLLSIWLLFTMGDNKQDSSHCNPRESMKLSLTVDAKLWH